MRRAARHLSLVLTVVTLLLVADAYAASRSSDPAPVVPAAPAADLLESLPIRPEADRAAYEREAFGDGWSVGPTGCDTRAEVLAAESTVPATRGPDECRVVAGRWVNIYDGNATTDPSDLEIDHVVALAEAWDSGAADWPPDRRVAFANDVAHQDALIAVTTSSNRSKSDSDPAEWLPADNGTWCWYAAAWIEVKAAWELSVDQVEHDALADVLDGCPGVER